jgi:hypothetical protein
MTDLARLGFPRAAGRHAPKPAAAVEPVSVPRGGLPRRRTAQATARTGDIPGEKFGHIHDPDGPAPDDIPY